MPASSRDRISVDLHGLKAALFDQARVRGVSPSDFVRNALIDALGRSDLLAESRSVTREFVSTQTRVRLSLRMIRHEASATLAAARHAGLSPGAYVAGLVAGIPALTGGASRADHVVALVASSAELSTLTRNIHHLTSLLRQGQVQAAQGRGRMHICPPTPSRLASHCLGRRGKPLKSGRTSMSHAFTSLAVAVRPTPSIF